MRKWGPREGSQITQGWSREVVDLGLKPGNLTQETSY